jgi:hypothetical protein
MTAPDRGADSTHRAGVTGRDGQTVRLGGQHHVEQAGTGSDPCQVGGGVDLDRSDGGRVDEECPVRRDARAVASRLDGDRHPVLAREPHGGHDIVGPHRAYHPRRALAHRPVSWRASAVEAIVRGREDRTLHGGPKPGEGVRPPDAHAASAEPIRATRRR